MGKGISEHGPNPIYESSLPLIAVTPTLYFIREGARRPEG
jgi:hypothetical protein